MNLANRPATQSAQVSFPAAALLLANRPGSHEEHHAAPGLAYFPTSHGEQVVEVVAAVAVEKRPATHSSHTEDPELASYLPAGHD